MVRNTTGKCLGGIWQVSDGCLVGVCLCLPVSVGVCWYLWVTGVSADDGGVCRYLWVSGGVWVSASVCQ